MSSLSPNPPSPGRGAASAPPRLADYELLRLIGRGSYGEVWLARGVTGIYRAIKLVRRASFSEAGPFEREFRGLKEFAAISLDESIQPARLQVRREGVFSPRDGAEFCSTGKCGSGDFQPL